MSLAVLLACGSSAPAPTEAGGSDPGEEAGHEFPDGDATVPMDAMPEAAPETAIDVAIEMDAPDIEPEAGPEEVPESALDVAVDPEPSTDIQGDAVPEVGETVDELAELAIEVAPETPPEVGEAIDAEPETPPEAELPGDTGPETSPLTCTSCHGSEDGPAPPKDTAGNTDTGSMGVGAHQVHLKGDPSRSGPIACTECHVVPTAPTGAGHPDGTVQVVFGTLATTQGVTPVFDATTGGCTGVWCHGAGLTAGTLTTPTWTKVDGSQDACGTCHGLPPTGTYRTPAGAQFNHFQSDSQHSSFACSTCHPDAVGGGSGGTSPSIIAPLQHVDGQPTLAAGVSDCSKCHN